MRTHSFALPSRALYRGRTVGLLGGSFNPPHEGHVHISLQAIKRLKLDAVWWLVSPQNPLKSEADTAPLPDRLAACRVLVRHPRIQVSALETMLGTRYTVDTLRQLIQRYPQTRFVWLMGADNLRQFHRWRQWREIAQLVPLIVLARGGEQNLAALASPAARKLMRYRVVMSHSEGLSTVSPPAWTWLSIPRHRASSTALRKNRAITPKPSIIRR